MRKLIRSITQYLPPAWMAWFDYHFRPSLRQSWGGAFNGQEGRRAIFLALAHTFRFKTLIETGTFRGTTTTFMAEHSEGMLHTVEVMPRFYHYARLRLKAYERVQVYLQDSIAFLQQLARDAEKHSTGTTFFYLDAHWHAQLPLDEEVRLIASHWRNVVIMIDDFEVPDDEGYQYDRYGDTALTLDYLQPLIEGKFTAFFPVLRSEEETGYKRGCVVLVDEQALSQIANVDLLRRG